MNIIWICLQARATGAGRGGTLRSHPGKQGSPPRPGIILPHLHLHAVSREPARAAFHGPETASPMLSTGGHRSQTGCWQRAAAGAHPAALRPDHHLHHHHPTFPSAFSPSLPFLPSSSWLFPGEDFGIHTEEKRTDGHSTGWACGGQRDAQMDTLEGDRRQRQGHSPAPARPPPCS